MATTKKTAKKTTTKTATKKTTTNKTTTKKPAAVKAPAIKNNVSGKKPKKNACRVIVPIVIVVAILAIAATLIVGFIIKNKTASCTKTNEISEGVSVTAKVDAEFDKDKLNKVNVSMKFENEEKAKEYCSIMNLVSDMGKEKIDVNCDGDTMKINSTAMLDGNEKLEEMNKKDFIAELEKEGYTCKK